MQQSLTSSDKKYKVCTTYLLVKKDSFVSYFCKKFVIWGDCFLHDTGCTNFFNCCKSVSNHFVKTIVYYGRNLLLFYYILYYIIDKNLYYYIYYNKKSLYNLFFNPITKFSKVSFSTIIRRISLKNSLFFSMCISRRGCTYFVFLINLWGVGAQ